MSEFSIYLGFWYTRGKCDGTLRHPSPFHHTSVMPDSLESVSEILETLIGIKASGQGTRQATRPIKNPRGTTASMEGHMKNVHT